MNLSTENLIELGFGAKVEELKIAHIQDQIQQTLEALDMQDPKYPLTFEYHSLVITAV